MKKTLFTILTLFFLAACTGGGSEKTTSENPFAGGSEGVTLSFTQFRDEVYDKGEDPFDIEVQLENKGETKVEAQDIKLTLAGFNPADLSQTAAALEKSPDTELTPVTKQLGAIVTGESVPIIFSELNYAGTVVGDSRQPLPIFANACYKYGTIGLTSICLRENLLSQTPSDICTVSEDKTTYNSGAPVHIEGFKQTATSKD